MKHTTFKLFLATASIAGSLLLSSVANAATTPSDIYKITEDIKAELAFFHDANISQPKTSILHHSARKPRHVLQKAREVFLKVQLLRRSKGLSENKLAPFEVKNVTPGDVGDLMDLVLRDLQGLRVEYETEAPMAVALMDGKSPSDVYANAADISVSIDALDIASVVPNDAYRIAITINNDLELIRDAKGITKLIEKQAPSKGKSPGDVLNQVHEIFVKLKMLSAKQGFEVKGGIEAPSMPKGKISPAIVLDAQNNALADIGAIKKSAGVKKPTEVVAQPSGKTPSDVYDAVSRAIAIIDSML